MDEPLCELVVSLLKLLHILSICTSWEIETPYETQVWEINFKVEAVPFIVNCCGVFPIVDSN